MKATLMLADHAEVAEGKLFINGGGWTTTGPDPVPFAIVAIIEVPWDQTNRQHKLRFELIDTDGNPVLGDNQEPVFLEIMGEVGRPPGVKPGSSIPLPLALFNPQGHPLPGGRYEWRLTIDGEGDEDWSLPFTVRHSGGQEMAA
jgi:hypothetical protein